MEAFAVAVSFIVGFITGHAIASRTWRRAMAELRTQYEHLEVQAERRELEVHRFHESCRRAFAEGGTITIKGP